MGFSETFSVVSAVLKKIGTELDESMYDGLIVKRLEASNTLDKGRTTKQSHIAITGAQMDMFPYVRADGYFEVDYDVEDQELKKFFVAQIPVYLHKENVEYLDSESSIFDEDEKLVHVSIVRSRRKDAADQIQMSMTYMDTPEYVQYRRIVHAGSYMIMLKRKTKLEYDIYCVKPEDADFGEYSLSKVNNCFEKMPTNTVVHLDEIVIEDKDEVQNEIEESFMDEYQRAASIVRNHIEETGLEFERPQESIDECRNELLQRFSPEKLAALSDDELLSSIFYTRGDNSESLCYWLEMYKDSRACFGSIAGGSAYKFGLFQKKDTGVWTTGSSQKPRDLSDEEALELGKRIRDALVKGADIIRNATLNSVEDYEQLNDTLDNEISGESCYYNWAWFHKYFSIVCPDKLSGFHNNDWQYHVLYCFGIKPSPKYYARSGQIAMIENYAGLSYMHLINAINDRFGGPINFVRLGTSDDERSYVAEWKHRSVVGIGWPAVGSLDEYLAGNSIDRTALSDKLSEEYYPNDKKMASRKAGELARFYNTNNSTVFAAMAGQKLIALVDEIGAYFYDSNNVMPHLKPGKWNMKFSDGDTLPVKSEGRLTSCYQITEEENIMYLYKKYYYDEENDEFEIEEEEKIEEAQEEGSQLKTCLEIEREPREEKIHPLNLIIYGAPGTGKTYSMVDYALAIIDNTGIKDFKAKNPNRKENITRYKNLVKAGQIVFTTFHQNYGYEEFIQGFRPDKDSPTLAFKNVDGVFKKIADKALNDTEGKNYVIIIDEINRANISKVFGELITLIEEDKRWGEVDEMSVTLQSGDPFAVPNNLYIIGTMNSADKSISLIDAALRRRFDFDEQKPEPSLIKDDTLRTVFNRLNKKLVTDLQSTDLLIGHSYFMNKTVDDLEYIMNRNVIPLLYEYYYDVRTKVAQTVEEAIKDTGVSIVDKKDDFGRLSVERSE